MQIAVCLSDTSSPTYHPDALPQRDARRWPARHRCPVGRFRHLEVVYPCDVLDDAVACVVPDIHVPPWPPVLVAVAKPLPTTWAVLVIALEVALPPVPCGPPVPPVALVVLLESLFGPALAVA